MVRPVRIVVGALVLLTAWAVCATAAHIDADLKKLLDDKSRSEIIPVLMVFPDQPALEDLEVMMDGATPQKRRNSTIAALKRQARKAQSDAWEVLEDPDLPGELAYAQMLYFSNSIAFGADREVILAVAEAGDKRADDAILFYDKDYELLADTIRLPGDGQKSAREDTTWNLKYVHVPEVWSQLGITGEGILIGHIDTGVDLAHPDLRHRLWVNPGELADNGLDDDGNGYVDDVYGWDFGDGDNDPTDDSVDAGHGTHTAGTAVGDGSLGVQTGAAPGARLLPVKVFSTGGTSSLGRLWAAQQYCIEQGCRIITMSLGIKGDVPDPYLRNDRFNADAIRAAGVVLFNSAGNEHQEFEPPYELGMTARIPAPWHAPAVPYSSLGGVVTVGATGYRADAAYDQASRGPAGWDQVDPWHDWPYMPGPGLIKPDVTAPGQGIRSLLPMPQGYSGETWSGTSMATPLVAGVAALMLAKNPTLSPAGVDSLLEMTARDLGAAGKDVVFGAGVIDALAAVTAVPDDLLPDLAEAELLADPGGDGVLDPGELAGAVFAVRNAGMVSATGISGQLTVNANPYVSVQTSAARFPDIAPGAVGLNALEPFVLAVSPLAPHGYSFTMTLTVTTAEGFERSLDLKSYLGLPEYRTHDAGEVYLTVTSRGSLGYVSDAQLNGDGMGRAGGPSALFLSSLWAGSGPAYMCNNDLTADGADPAEWRPRLDPTGNVRVVQDVGGEQIFTMAFDDRGHAEPRGITVTLTSSAWADPALADVVKLDYLISNEGDSYFAGYHAGLFVDWDVIDSLGNVGGIDLNTRSVWVGMPDGPVCGMAVVGDAPLSNLSLIDNLEYVYPTSHVIDAHKYQFLNGTLHTPAVTEPTDLSAVVAVGPLDLDPGQRVRVTILVAYGDSVADFLTNVAAAGGGTGPVTPVEPPVPRPAFALDQNNPNPFNPSTRIGYSLPRAGEVNLAVYDLKGRLVRTLQDGRQAAGEYGVRWDGRDDRGGQAASGIYLYRLITEEGTLARKMIMVK
ncbi:MAG: S8 family serine peptidase [Candidatus Krumholzibacteriia bacterium]